MELTREAKLGELNNIQEDEGQEGANVQAVRRDKIQARIRKSSQATETKNTFEDPRRMFSAYSRREKCLMLPVLITVWTTATFGRIMYKIFCSSCRKDKKKERKDTGNTKIIPQRANDEIKNWT